MGCSPGCRNESDTTERITLSYTGLILNNKKKKRAIDTCNKIDK